MSTGPSVLFVCVRNAGKSQLAAALARHRAGHQLTVHSAGTRPGAHLNRDVVTVLRESAVDTSIEHPKSVGTGLLATADRVVLLGEEVDLDVPAGTRVERWVLDEPSRRGITGLERMRLVRDEVAARVGGLLDELGVAVRIAPLEPEHWPAVERIYAAGIATGHATFEIRPPSWETFDASRRPDLRLVATDTDGAVLGWAAASPVSTRAVYAGVVEHSLYVAPEHQGAGVGRMLLEALLRSAAAVGVWTVQSGAFGENEASLALHRRAGFRVVGTRERVGRMTHGPLAGAWRDVVWVEHRRP